MTITTINFPAGARFQSVEFELARRDAVNRFAGVQVQAIALADAVWSAKFTTEPLRHYDQAGAWSAWKDKLRGAAKAFYGYDTKRPYPAASPTGFDGLVKAGTATAFTGTDVDVTAMTSTTLSLDDLPANYRLAAGDYIGLVEGNKRALHRIVTDVTASAGGVATVNVEPFVRTSLITLSAVAVLAAPTVQMILVPGSFKGASGVLTPASFEAVEVLS